jgi:hypothetical protein
MAVEEGFGPHPLMLQPHFRRVDEYPDAWMSPERATR